MTQPLVIPWYKRFQIEIGGRWQAVPDRNTTFRQWLFDPFCGYTYPGKIIKDRQELPDGEVFGGLEILGNNEYRALVWWLRFGIRVLGLDIGAGVFIRSRESVAKLTKQGEVAK